MPREVTSGREVGRNLEKALRAARAGITRDLESLGLNLVNQIRLDLSKPGSGTLYTSRFFTDRAGNVIPYGRRAPHRASAPGDPPAVDTGQLRASYGHQVQRGRAEDTLTIGTGVEYAKWLEFGTSKMAARPHLRPVVYRNLAKIPIPIRDGIVGRERAMARRLGGEG